MNLTRRIAAWLKGSSEMPLRNHSPRHVHHKTTYPGLKVISICDDGAWTSNPGGAASTHDYISRNDPLLGRSMIEVTTSGASDDKYVQAAFPTPYDATGKNILIAFRIENEARIDRMQAFVFEDGSTANYYKWQKIQGSMIPKFFKDGRWVYLSLSFEDAIVYGTPNRAKLNRFRLLIGDDGTGPVTCAFNLYALYDKPSSVASISFDDGYVSVFTEGKPVLDRYGFPGTIFLPPSNVGRYGRLTIAQMKHLERVGWEVASHWTGDDLRLESEETIRRYFRMCLEFGDKHGFPMDGFCYPGGQHGFLASDPSRSVEDIAKDYFRYARTINQSFAESLPPNEPHLLRVVYVTYGSSVEWVRQRIDSCVAAGQWIHLVFHDILPGSSTPTKTTEYNADSLNLICQHLAGKRIPVRTVGAVMDDAQRLGAARR